MRILFIGSCSSFFLVPLAKALRKENPEVFLGVYGLLNPAGELSQEDQAVFDQVYPNIEGKLKEGKLARLKAVMQLIHDQGAPVAFWKAVFSGKVKSFITQKESELKILDQRRQIGEISKGFDLVQVHYLKENNLNLVEKVPANKLLLSFWGSDLMQAEDHHFTARKKKLLADCLGISIHGADLAFVASVKYGWNLRDKMSFALFPLNEEIIRGIDQSTKEDALAFLSEFGSIPKGRRIVAMGYNSHPRFKHLEILDHLHHLNEGLMEQMHFVFTFGYGHDPQEQENIVQKLQQYGCSYSIVDRYLENEEVGKLRNACDTFMFLTDSDAFSGTMIEYLYAGAHVITGTWLPFGKLRRAGIAFSEVEAVEDLRASDLLNWSAPQDQHQRVLDLIAASAPGKNWMAMYQKLLLQQKSEKR
jgi:hypothetical protein